MGDRIRFIWGVWTAVHGALGWWSLSQEKNSVARAAVLINGRGRDKPGFMATDARLYYIGAEHNEWMTRCAMFDSSQWIKSISSNLSLCLASAELQGVLKGLEDPGARGVDEAGLVGAKSRLATTLLKKLQGADTVCRRRRTTWHLRLRMSDLLIVHSQCRIAMVLRYWRGGTRVEPSRNSRPFVAKDYYIRCVFHSR